MPTLTVTPSKKIEHSIPSDFGAEISGKKLLVPQNVADALARLSIRTAEEFVSYVDSFPHAVAAELGWSIEDVMRARPSLVAKLKGYVPNAILNPLLPPKRVYGAFPPSTPQQDQADQNP